MDTQPLASVFASGRYAGAICIAASLASSSQGEAAGALQALALKAAPSERAALSTAFSRLTDEAIVLRRLGHSEGH